MDRYLFDTTVLIDISKGQEPASSRIQALIDAGHELGVCAVPLAEFFSGIPPEDRSRAEADLRPFRYWDMTWEIAVQAGGFRYAYARLGQAISAPDALIAATAIALDAILVTNNVRYFPMPELRLLRIGT